MKFILLLIVFRFVPQNLWDSFSKAFEISSGLEGEVEEIEVEEQPTQGEGEGEVAEPAEPKEKEKEKKNLHKMFLNENTNT